MTMTRRTKGRLAEAKVLTHFIENDYEVYTPFSDNSKYDLLVFKDRLLQKVSIKFTSSKTDSGRWNVALRNVSRRNGGELNTDKFDRELYDLLAVYIQPEDRVVVVSVDSFTSTSTLVVG